MNELYTPYEELDLRFIDNVLLVKTPWINIKAEINQDAYDFVNYCIRNLHSDREIESISKFLEEFKDYPISYVKSQTDKDADEIDTMYLITTLRRERLLGCVGLETNGYDKEDIKQFIFQNYFITHKSEEILKQASELYPYPEVVEYYRDEIGHDKFVAKVIDIIGWDDFFIDKSVKKLMKAFEDATRYSFTAFLVCVDFFEGIPTTEKHCTLAYEVRKHFGSEAAKPIQKHFEINQSHNHSQVAQDLARLVPKTSTDDSLYCRQLNETLINCYLKAD